MTDFKTGRKPLSDFLYFSHRSPPSTPDKRGEGGKSLPEFRILRTIHQDIHREEWPLCSNKIRTCLRTSGSSPVDANLGYSVHDQVFRPRPEIEGDSNQARAEQARRECVREIASRNRKIQFNPSRFLVEFLCLRSLGFLRAI